MTKAALVTGSSDHVEAVAAALQEMGVDVRRSERLDRSSTLDHGSVDCYVQMPSTIEPRGDTTVERVHAFLSEGLLGRYEAAIAVAPAIRDGGSVILVGGNRPAYETGPDAQSARTSLLNVLANALRADLGGRGVRVDTVEAGASAGTVARIATEGRTPRGRSDVADFAPELDYDDWRLAVLSLDRIEA